MIETLLARQLRQAAANQRQQADTLEAMADQLELAGAHALATKPALLSIEEFCAQVKVCPDTARMLCATGQIKGAFQRQERGRWLIPYEGMALYLAELTKQPGRPALSIAGGRAK